MRVSERQLLVLLETLGDSLKVADNGGLVFGYDHEARDCVYTEIINQANTTPVEVGEEPTNLVPPSRVPDRNDGEGSGPR